MECTWRWCGPRCSWCCVWCVALWWVSAVARLESLLALVLCLGSVLLLCAVWFCAGQVMLLVVVCAPWLLLWSQVLAQL